MQADSKEFGGISSLTIFKFLRVNLARKKFQPGILGDILGNTKKIKIDTAYSLLH